MKPFYVQQLNDLFGIDGPSWLYDDPSTYTVNKKVPPVCPPPIHFGETHHMKKEEYRKKVSEKLTGRKGRPVSDEQKAKQSLKMKEYCGEKNPTSEWWEITFEDGSKVVRCGLSNWCKQNNYNKSHVSAVYTGKRSKHKDIVAVAKVAHGG